MTSAWTLARASAGSMFTKPAPPSAKLVLPPRVSSFSSMTTLASGACSLVSMAAVKPPMPEPTTTTSASSVASASTGMPMPSGLA